MPTETLNVGVALVTPIQEMLKMLEQDEIVREIKESDDEERKRREDAIRGEETPKPENDRSSWEPKRRVKSPRDAAPPPARLHTSLKPQGRRRASRPTSLHSDRRAGISARHIEPSGSLRFRDSLIQKLAIGSRAISSPGTAASRIEIKRLAALPTRRIVSRLSSSAKLAR
jgi:hypothetical protein